MERPRKPNCSSSNDSNESMAVDSASFARFHIPDGLIKSGSIWPTPGMRSWATRFMGLTSSFTWSLLRPDGPRGSRPNCCFRDMPFILRSYPLPAKKNGKVRCRRIWRDLFRQAATYPPRLSPRLASDALALQQLQDDEREQRHSIAILFPVPMVAALEDLISIHWDGIRSERDLNRARRIRRR